VQEERGGEKKKRGERPDAVNAGATSRRQPHFNVSFEGRKDKCAGETPKKIHHQ